MSAGTLSGPPCSDRYVRPYRSTDLDAVYGICLRTGDAGRDATSLIENGRLFGELWAAPCVTFEPEHAIVLDDGTGTPIGYVLGMADAVAFEQRCERDWWPTLRQRYPLVPGGTRLDDLLISLVHHRPEPDRSICDRYPSELHIDLLPAAQGQGWGRRLIDAVLGSLSAAGSPGVHLGTSAQNARAIAFFERLGFERLTPPTADVLVVDFAMRLDPEEPPT